MRIIICISILIGFKVCLGQPETDFPAQLIKVAGVDSCIVTVNNYNGQPEQLHSKLSYNVDGTVYTEVFPTRNFHPVDTFIEGFLIYTHNYDSLNRLDYVSGKTEFKSAFAMFVDYSNEQFIYNGQGQLIAHLFYGPTLEKVVSYHYKYEKLVLEITTENMQSSKKNYYYSNAGKVVTTGSYDYQGSLLDSTIEEVDSSKFTKAYTYYEFRTGSHRKVSPQYYLYQFDSDWKVQGIKHFYEGYESTTTFLYDEKELLVKSEFRGDEKYDFIYSYRFKSEQDEEK